MNFARVMTDVDVAPLALALHRQPGLFGIYQQRTYQGSPHEGVTDIWVRTNDPTPFVAGERPWSEFQAEHDPVWLPVSIAIPQVRPIVFQVMAAVQGERLGGVLITKMAPDSEVAPHVDDSWHARYFYDKYHVALDVSPGTVFAFNDGEIRARNGEVWWFRNDVPHWIRNDSKRDRLSLVIAIAPSRFPG